MRPHWRSSSQLQPQRSISSLQGRLPASLQGRLPAPRAAFSDPAQPAHQQQQVDRADAGQQQQAAAGSSNAEFARATAARRLARRREQVTYQASAIAATTGVSGLAVLACYYKFMWLAAPDAPIPWADMAGTLALVVGGVIGMEMWARWAHRALWHDFAPGWALHKSHHEPRLGPFEANDVYAVANAIPAIGLCLHGFLTPGLAGSLAFGGGLGITLFGIAYMFVHDGLVHKRFPVGPIAELTYMKRVTVAHRLHHSEKYGGVPYGLFLGPQELESIGAGPELDRLVDEMEVKSLSSSPSRR